MSGTSAPGVNTLSRLLRIGIKIAITLGLLAVLVRGTDLVQIGGAVRNVSWMPMTTAIVILLLLSLAQASRWQAILQALGTHVRYRAVWVMVLIGFFFSQLLPTSIGGDVARVWKLRQAGAPMSRALNSVVLDRITALIAAALITVAGAGLLFALFPGPVMRYMVIGTALATISGLAVLLLVDRMPRAQHLLEHLPGKRLGPLIAGTVGDARAALLDPRTLSLTITLSCLTHIAVSCTVWLIATDIGAQVDVLSCVVLVPLVILVSMLPVSIAGWGVREGAMMVALGAVGVDRATALTTSVLFGLALAATGIPGGLLWLRGRKHTVGVA